MKRFVSLTIAALLATAAPVLAGSAGFEAPAAVRWNASVDQIRQEVEPLCADGIEVRQFDPPQIPGASDHRQIDCAGFQFRGKARKLEFIFADDRLQGVWILMDAGDTDEVVAAMRQTFGEPSVEFDGVVAFAGSRALWRGDKSEVLLYAPEMSELMNMLLSRKSLPN